MLLSVLTQFTHRYRCSQNQFSQPHKILDRGISYAEIGELFKYGGKGMANLLNSLVWGSLDRGEYS